MHSSNIKKFYDHIQFPGRYSRTELNYHIPKIRNNFLNLIDTHLTDANTILDVGCGTGLISNLFAVKNPNKKFVALDFSNAVDYGSEFAKDQKINNVTYIKQDFTTYTDSQKYDVVICQGVLHHIPEYQLALEKMQSLINPGGKLILGLYHPVGKILKKFISLDYKSNTLKLDQELNPFEISFTQTAVKKMLPLASLIDCYPKNPLMTFALHPIANSLNGGLITYVFQKN
jgi:2-polyprenyl-3-methyl-5-hydroxy-6-metoxy-1,4-benzoquinol methylase